MPFVLALLLAASPALPTLDALAGPAAQRVELRVFRSLGEVPREARAAFAYLDFSKWMLVQAPDRQLDLSPVVGKGNVRRTTGGLVLQIARPHRPPRCPPCSGIDIPHLEPELPEPVPEPQPTVFAVPRSQEKVFLALGSSLEPIETGEPCKPCVAQ